MFWISRVTDTWQLMKHKAIYNQMKCWGATLKRTTGIFWIFWIQEVRMKCNICKKKLEMTRISWAFQWQHSRQNSFLCCNHIQNPTKFRLIKRLRPTVLKNTKLRHMVIVRNMALPLMVNLSVPQLPTSNRPTWLNKVTTTCLWTASHSKVAKIFTDKWIIWELMPNFWIKGN